MSEAMARVKIGSSEEVIEVWQKDPSTAAFIDLMNRYIDKPAEQTIPIDLDPHGDWAELREILSSARARIEEEAHEPKGHGREKRRR